MAAGSLRIGSFLDTGVIFCLMASISRLRRRSRCEPNPPPPWPPPPSASLSVRCSAAGSHTFSHLKPCSVFRRVQNREENAAEATSAGLLFLLRQNQGTSAASWPSEGARGGGRGGGGGGRAAAGGGGGGAGLGCDCKPRLQPLERLACFAAAAVSPLAHSRFDRLSRRCRNLIGRREGGGTRGKLRPITFCFTNTFFYS